MPAVEVPTEKWKGKIREVTLGGGGRKTVVVGGESTMPFLHFEGEMPNRPLIAIEIQDCTPEWPSQLASAWGDALKDPASWARAAAAAGADLIALSLKSAHPDNQNTGAKEAEATVKRVLDAMDLPIMVLGPSVAEKDNEVLVAAADAARGTIIALGNCEEKNYRTIVAACLSSGHVAIAKTPIEINLAKQLNILICDMGLAADRIIVDPTTGALGYGLEYTYSVMERLRLAGLQGDGMTGLPLLVTPGEEAWRQKEARAADGVPEAWGKIENRAILWEAMTATSLLLAGADVVVMRHPRAIELVKATIDKWMAK
ncbi:MAG: acetyl-CoA decarbonylase/synthase complex subunit delta [Dehalococcoidia bacterium]|nr:acetyl-CoA decarbonylase/synthase complex subunit delta [Dehalococcoidia bacterium]